MNEQRIPGEDDVPEMDLGKYDNDYAEAPCEDEYESPPDANYQVRVERVELKNAKSSGNPMLSWTLRILGPSSEGRQLWRNNVIASKENLRWLKHDLHICGLDLQKLSDLPKHLEQLLDVKLEVTKRTKGDNENVYFNRRVVMGSEGAVAVPKARPVTVSKDRAPF